MLSVLALVAVATAAYVRPFSRRDLRVRDHLIHTLPSRSYLAKT